MNNVMKIEARNLMEGGHVYLEGEIAYSRIGSHIEGAELAKVNERNSKRGMTPIDKKHTQLTIRNVRILPKNPAANPVELEMIPCPWKPDRMMFTPKNPSVLDINEQYIIQRFYAEKDENGNPTAVPMYNNINKSPFLPNVSVLNGTVAEQTDMNGREFAVGMKVMLDLDIYKPKNNPNNKGVGVNAIIAKEPIRYYTAQSVDLSAMGLTYKPLEGEAARNAVDPSRKTAQETASPAGVAGPSANTDPYSAVAQAMAQAPAAAPVAAPVAAAPAPAQAPQQPTQPQTDMSAAMNPPETGTQVGGTTPASPWVCPNCGITNAANQNFCGNCGNKKSDSAPNPYAGHNQTTPGIAYDPNSKDRNY